MALVDFQRWRTSHTVVQHHFFEVHQMAQVSKLWKGVILNTAVIWALVHSSYAHHLQVQAFVRSKNAPLTVFWGVDVTSSTSRSKQVQLFCTIAKPHVHRSRFLCLDLNTWDDFQNLLDAKSAPHLEAMQLSLRYAPHTLGALHPRLNPYEGNATKLTELELDGVPIVWDSQLLNGLRTLTLSNMIKLGHPPPPRSSPRDSRRKSSARDSGSSRCRLEGYALPLR